MAGLVLLGLLLVLIAWLPRWLLGIRDQAKDLAQLGPQDRIKAVNDLRGVFLNVLAGMGLALTIYFSARTFQLNRRGQVNERFTKAIEQLGSLELDVRLGGIYALEQIARDSRELHGPIVEILCAFLRLHGGRTGGPSAEALTNADKAETLTRVPADLQAAITILGRRKIANDAPGQRLDLREIVLPPGASFAGAQLQWADFSGAQLTRALFEHAQLERASFVGAQLQEAFFTFAQLASATLARAQLQGTHFTGAQLKGASFIDAELQGAIFSGAQLEAALFVNAHLKRAIFSGAQPERTSFLGAQPVGASFLQAQLEEASARELLGDAENLDLALLQQGWDSESVVLPSYLAQQKTAEEPTRVDTNTLPSKPAARAHVTSAD